MTGDEEVPQADRRSRGPGGIVHAQVAYDRIRTAIVEGQHQPGQRLTEKAVAEELELSRTPVREALQRLSAEGLVVTRPNRGATVRPITVQWIRDLYEFRARLEGYAAKRAAAYATEADVAALSDAIEGFEHAIPRAADGSLEGIRALSQHNNEFHESIVGASCHDRLESVLAHTVDIPLVFQAFRCFTTDEHHRSNIFHRIIRDSIAAGEGERAEGAMAQHIYLGRDALLADIERAEQFSPALQSLQQRRKRA